MSDNNIPALTLTKVIPQRTETVTFKWIKKDFSFYAAFKAVRDKHRLPNYPNCWWCNKEFKAEDMMALAGHQTGNKLICQECADFAARSK
jgi:hypothetical protein